MCLQKKTAQRTLFQFFKFECQNPYEVMLRVDLEMYHLEKEMKSIQESGALFEVNVPEFKLLKQCRKELRMLKVIGMIKAHLH